MKKLVCGLATLCILGASTAFPDVGVTYDAYVFALPGSEEANSLNKLEEIRTLGFAKDSYGNPVTPFALSDADVAQRNGAVTDASGILLPAYASGIIGFVDPNLPAPKLNLNLEPPLSNGNFYYPGVNSDISTETYIVDGAGQKPSEDLLPPVETNFNGLFNQPTPKPQPPATDLLPPFEGQAVDRNSVIPAVVPTQQTPTRAPLAPRPAPPTVPRPQTTAPQQILEQTQFIVPKPQAQFTAPKPQNQFTAPKPQQIPVVIQAPASPPRIPNTSPPKKVTGSKYTGGFGGAPGLLSPLGGPKPEPNKAALSQAPISQPSSLQAAVIPQADTVKVTVVKQPIIKLPTRFEETTGSRYTGGFGGPPGLLNPFDNINQYQRFGESQ